VCGVLVCPWMPRVPQPQSSVPKCSRYGEAEAQGEGAEAGRFELRKVKRRSGYLLITAYPIKAGGRRMTRARSCSSKNLRTHAT
jgi:hypothetical protein